MTQSGATASLFQASEEAEAAFFAALAQLTRPIAPLTFRRASRTDGAPHIVHLDPTLLTPVNPEHPCSCKAGAEGRYCWALLEVLADETPRLSQSAEVLERAEMARAVQAERAARAPKRRK